MRQCMSLPYVQSMEDHTVSNVPCLTRPPANRPWEAAHETAASRVRIAWLTPVAMVCALAIVSLIAATLPEPLHTMASPAVSRGDVDATSAGASSAASAARRLPHGCDGTCEFSSAGSADLHAFDRTGPGVLHVLYLEARWTKPRLRTLRRDTEVWQQTVTMRAAQIEDRRPIVMEHWSSDLAMADVKLTATEQSVSFTVTVSKLGKLRPGRLYRTQILLRSPRDLDGDVWHYSEHIEGTATRGQQVRVQGGKSSAPRRGISGWCPDCYVVWDVGEKGRPTAASR